MNLETLVAPLPAPSTEAMPMPRGGMGPPRPGLLRRGRVPLVCLTVWAAFMPSMIRHVSLRHNDRVFYLEAAESLVAGRGLMQRPIYGISAEQWVPLTIWAPGYPVLVAGFHAMGLPAYDASLLVNLMCGAAMVLILGWFCVRLLPEVVALPVALTFTLNHTFLEYCTNGMTDVPYTTLTAAALFCLVQWFDRGRQSAAWLFWAGLLGGAAYAVRYIGLCLLPPSLLFVVYFGGRNWRPTAAWLTGTAVCLVPMSIAGRTAAGYHWPNGAQSSSLWKVAKETAVTLFTEMTASTDLAKILADRAVLLSGVLVLVCAATYVVWAVPPRIIWEAVRKFMPVVLMVGFALAYLAAFIAARTKWEGEMVHDRYMLPVCWIVWIVLAVLLWHVFGVIPARLRKAIVIGVFGVCLTVQVRWHVYVLGFYPDHCRTIEDWVGRPQGELLSAVPDDQIILCSRADLLRIHGGKNGRFLPRAKYQHEEDFRCPTRAELRAAGEAGYLWGIAIDPGDYLKSARDGVYGDVMKELVTHPEGFPEYDRIAVDGPLLIFRYRKQGPTQEERP